MKWCVISMFFLFSVQLSAQKIEAPIKAKALPSISELATLPSTEFKENYYQNLAIFCKLEYKLEKKSGVPVRMRLGSLDYVNQLEGKK